MNDKKSTAPAAPTEPVESSFQKALNAFGHDGALEQTLKQRDHYEETADDLADLIAAMTGVDIGEHSSANNPWQNAKFAAEEFIATKQAAPKAEQTTSGAEPVADAEDAARWRRLVNASEMSFPVAAIADDPENDHTMLYGRKRLEEFVDRLDEISDTYAARDAQGKEGME